MTCIQNFTKISQQVEKNVFNLDALQLPVVNAVKHACGGLPKSREL